MNKNLVSLRNLMNNLSEEKLNKILEKFKSIKENDIENFLHNKSSHFEKSTISSTYLIFGESKEILGYFTIANRSLVISKENFSILSKTQQNKVRKQCCNIKKW